MVQISELLRLTQESYFNVKLKYPDTGQHTVLFESKKVKDANNYKYCRAKNRFVYLQR